MFLQDLKKYLLSFLISFIPMVLFIELIWIPMKERLPRDFLLMGFVGAPNQMVDDTKLNSMGFTGDEIQEAKPANTIRILTLGGSALFNRRMTERIKAGLQPLFSHRLEILGGALRSHTSASSLRKLEVLRKYHFDYLLIYDNINDLWANNAPLKDFKEDYSHLGPWYQHNLFLDHSLIVRKIYNFFSFRKTGPKLYYAFPDANAENQAHFASESSLRKNLKTLVEESRDNEITPILMTFAYSILDNYSLEKFKEHSLGYNNPNNYDAQPVELWGSPNYVREGIERHNKVIREVSKEMGVLLIDQEALVGKDLRWFGDLCHLSEEGTDLFVQNIKSFFEKQLHLASNKIDPSG